MSRRKKFDNVRYDLHDRVLHRKKFTKDVRIGVLNTIELEFFNSLVSKIGVYKISGMRMPIKFMLRQEVDTQNQNIVSLSLFERIKKILGIR